MTQACHFVYALSDPRRDPATPFYVGRAAGSRGYDQLVQADDSAKGRRIREIEAAGMRVHVSFLLEDVSEAEAIRVVARLIAEHGLASHGGRLLNPDVRRGASARLDDLERPPVMEHRLPGLLSALLELVRDLARANPGGISGADLASQLSGGRPAPARYANLAHGLLAMLVHDGVLTHDAVLDRYSAAHPES